MDRNEIERRTTSILEDYAKCKYIFLDAVYESQRAKDDQYKRVMAFHETHVTLLTRRIRLLQGTLDRVSEAAMKHSTVDSELVKTINTLNRAVLHSQLQAGGSSFAPSAKDPMLLEPEPNNDMLAALSTAGEANATEACTPVEAQLLRETIHRQESEIASLRKALDTVVNKVQCTLELKTKNAVEEILKESAAENETATALEGDPYLQRAAEQRRKDLAAISNAQLEIDRLHQEKDALIASLRKAEQDVVQMRLKMMERDSSMAIISKRIKTIESKLLEETSTSAKRIEAAERLAGDITVKYESEVRRLRTAIEQGGKEREHLQLEIDHQKQLVQDAKDETEEVRKEIEAARVEGFERGTLSMVPKVEEAHYKLSESEAALLVSQDSCRDLRSKLRDTTQQLERTQMESNSLGEQLQSCRVELDEVSQELAQRMQGPFGCAVPRTPASREQSSNGILTVAPLIDEMVVKAAGDPQYTETALRRLSTRLAKVHAWSATSDKAHHPSMAHRVSSAVHDLSAAMLAVASSGVPPPPTPSDMKRRQSRRASSAPKDDGVPLSSAEAGREDTSSSGGGGGGSSQQHRRSVARVTLPHDSSASPDARPVSDPALGPDAGQGQRIQGRMSFRAFTEDTVVLEGSPSNRRASTQRTLSKDMSSEGHSVYPFETDSIDTPSSSENDGDDDMFAGPPVASVGTSCKPEVQDRGVQADEAAMKKKAEAASLQTKRASVKLTAKKDSVPSSLAASQLPSPSHARTRKSDDPLLADITVFTATVSGRRPPTRHTDALSALQSLEQAARTQMEWELRRAYVEMENSLRVCRVTLEQLQSNQQLRQAAEAVKNFAPAMTAFVDSKQAESQRSFIGESRAASHLRDAVVSMGLSSAAPSQRNLTRKVVPSSTQAGSSLVASFDEAPSPSSPSDAPDDTVGFGSDVEAMLEITEAYDFKPVAIDHIDVIPEEENCVSATVSVRRFNELVVVLHQAQRDINQLVRIKDNLSNINERVQGQMDVLLSTMDDGGKRLLSQASTLPFFSNMFPTGKPASSTNRTTRVKSEDSAQARMLFELIHWFQLEGQRFIARNFLPDGRPLAYEGRPPTSQQQVQDRLAAMLESMRHQKEYVVLEAEKRAKRRKGKKTELPRFLESPDVVEGAAIEPLWAAQSGDGGVTGRGNDEDLDLEPLERNALAQKVHRSPRNADLRSAETDDDSSSGDEDSPFVAPIVPTLVFPQNPSTKKLELEALVQPLLKALRKRLAVIGLDGLLDPELRPGVALQLACELEESIAESAALHQYPNEAGSSSALKMKWKGLRAALSYESTQYMKDDQHHVFFQSLFHTFPRSLLQRLTKDYNREYAQQLILNVAQWWDNWCPHITNVLEAIEGRKTDQLRRLIEIAEQVEDLHAYFNNGPDKSTGSTGGVVERDTTIAEMDQRAHRKEEALHRKLLHPAVTFSLQSKVRVTNQHPRDPLHRTPGDPLPKFQHKRSENPLQHDLQHVAASATDGMVGSLQRVSPVPTVATLSNGPQWNLVAKKPVSKWEARLPPLK